MEFAKLVMLFVQLATTLREIAFPASIIWL